MEDHRPGEIEQGLFVAWLANALARRGRGLKAGEFVTTGSICEVIWVKPGDVAIATIESLGSVSARF